jgi:hypothetical protein
LGIRFVGLGIRFALGIRLGIKLAISIQDKGILHTANANNCGVPYTQRLDRTQEVAGSSPASSTLRKLLEIRLFLLLGRLRVH